MGSLDPTCFAKGTLITTAVEHIPIEALKPGDLVLTASNGYQPVRWIGWRDVDLVGVPELDRRRNQPILFFMSSISDSTPFQDLVISASHNMFLGGRLAPAGNFVNGRDIVAFQNIHTICYYHLEFDEFEIVFANGATAESYVDVGNRYRFDHFIGEPAGHNLIFDNNMKNLIINKLSRAHQTVPAFQAAMSQNKWHESLGFSAGWHPPEL